MYKVGEQVKIKYSGRYESDVLKNKFGIIKQIWYPSSYGIEVDGLFNSSSKTGLFWLSDDCFLPANTKPTKHKGECNMNNKLTGRYDIAIVNLVEDYKQKDYGFALYESDWINVREGSYVLVNPQNKITLGIVKRIIPFEEYGTDVTKEVVGVCDMSAYYGRVEERQKEIERQKREAQLRKELDERISKLKDMEYYNRMAKELADKDPEIASLVSELGTVVGE